MRNKIQPLGVCQESLHTLAGCLICETQNEMRSVVQWDGPSIQGRQSTLRELQVYTDRLTLCIFVMHEVDAGVTRHVFRRRLFHLMSCYQRADW